MIYPIRMITAGVLLSVSQIASAAPVSFRIQNLGNVIMTVGSNSYCGVLSPIPASINIGTTSPTATTDCGGVVSGLFIDYKAGTKSCRFTISTLYTPPNPLSGASGYWTPSANAISQSGSATCKIVSQDVSRIFTTGAFAAVFSMK